MVSIDCDEDDNEDVLVMSVANGNTVMLPVRPMPINTPADTFGEVFRKASVVDVVLMLVPMFQHIPTNSIA